MCETIVRSDGHLHDGELDAGQLDVVRRPAQAGLHERWGRQGGDIEHAPGTRDALQSPGHCGIGELHDDGQLGPDLPDS